MTSIDWDKVLHDTEEGTKLVPVGEYLVRVTDAQVTNASTTGAPMIKTVVKLQDGPYAGRVITTNLVFTFGNPQAMKMLLRRLRALGISAEWLAETNAKVDDIAREILGRTVLAKVSSRKWQGEDRNDIEMFLESGSGIPMADGEFPSPASSFAPDMGAGESIPTPDLSSIENGEEPF